MIVNYHGTEYTISGIVTNQALSNYRSGIRSAVRGLWSGVLSFEQFFEVMDATIRLGINQAWNEGAREVGVSPSELTPQERIEIQRMISSELSHVFTLAGCVESKDKASGGLLRDAFSGCNMEAWILRAQDAKNRGILSAKDDPKLIWRFDPAKENCISCARLTGKIKRASMWKRLDLHPQDPPNEKLECGGWLCGCTLTPTDAPLSRGPLPGLP